MNGHTPQIYQVPKTLDSRFDHPSLISASRAENRRTALSVS